MGGKMYGEVEMGGGGDGKWSIHPSAAATLVRSESLEAPWRGHPPLPQPDCVTAFMMARPASESPYHACDSREDLPSGR